MTHTLTHAGRWARLRAPLLALAVLASACDSADKLASTEPTVAMEGASLDSAVTDSLATDSTITSDSTALTDSTSFTDSLDLELDAADLAEIEASEAAVLRGGVPFGPYGLWANYTDFKPGATHFTSSFTATNASGLVRQLRTAQAKNHRLFVILTAGHASKFMTNGKFDLGKWKRRVDTFNRADIKAAVRTAVANGTLMTTGLLDDADVPSRWGGVITKPLLDEMARYIKRMFPTLPVSVNVQYDWRSHERFRVVDAVYSQYRWWRTSGNIQAYRDRALEAARRDGVSIVFGLNILDGGIPNRGRGSRACVAGRGTYGPNCRMTAKQVAEWGKTLGQAGCALLMWRYDAAYLANAANVQAFKEVGSTLARTQGKSCRRPGRS